MARESVPKLRVNQPAHASSVISRAEQSNTDATPVPTRHQAEMYCCKYCSKFTKGKGHTSALHEIVDDMQRTDTLAQDKCPESFEQSTLGKKLHRAFMAQIGNEMCQAEVSHHANRLPEYFISREVKYVYLYKKALGLSTKASKSKGLSQRLEDVEAEAQPMGENLDEEDPEERLGTKLSDVELYENRSKYRFYPDSARFISPYLPQQNTPEEQVAAANLWEFFRFVRYKGGRFKHFQWYEPAELPVVIMSPVVKFTEGADFAFGARWALM